MFLYIWYIIQLSSPGQTTSGGVKRQPGESRCLIFDLKLHSLIID